VLDILVKAMATDIDPNQIGGTCRFYQKEYPDVEECGE
jgi:hypothetical protein